MEAPARERLLQALPADAAGRMLAGMPRGMALDSLLALGPHAAQRVLDGYEGGQRAALLSHLTVADALRLVQVGMASGQAIFVRP
jgi:hypothetical protein